MNTIKKTLLKSTLVAALAFGLAAAFAPHAFAMMPSLTVSTYATTQIQISVYGDPNSAVQLSYPSTYGGQVTSTIGYTSGNGYFATTLSSASYPIANGQSVSVVVDGQQSQYVSWPYVSAYQTYSNYNSYPYANYSYANTNYGYAGSYTQPITLSSTVATLSPGQSQSIQIYGSNWYANNYNTNYYNSGTYYVSSNSNPSIVSASVTGSALVVYGTGTGSSTITVCPASNGYQGSGCATVVVTVNSIYPYNTNYGTGYYNQNYYQYPYTYNSQYYGNLSYPVYNQYY